MSHGKTHAANAAAAVAVAAALARPWGFDPAANLAHLAVGAHAVSCLATGAALIPDVDHPQSTIARTGGIVGRPFARAIDKVTDHRRETHSLVTAAAVCGALAVAQHFAPVVGVVAATALTGLAFDLRKPGTNVLAAVVRFGLAFAVVTALTNLGTLAAAACARLADLLTLALGAPVLVTPPPTATDVTWGHLPLVTFVGWAIACIGDSCTNSGAHLLYMPLPRQLAERYPRFADAVQRRYHLTRPDRAWRMAPGQWSPTETRIYSGSFVVIAVGALTALGVTSALVSAADPMTAWQSITDTVVTALQGEPT